MRYEQNVVFVRASYKHVRIYESTYIPQQGCRPWLEQAPSARGRNHYMARFSSLKFGDSHGLCRHDGTGVDGKQLVTFLYSVYLRHETESKQEQKEK